jgi:hypothetical protein
MSTIDYNVNNYTISELLTILNLEEDEDTFTSDNITNRTQLYINRFEEENKPKLVSFFQDIQTKLLRYLNSENIRNEFEPNEEQTKKWIEYQALPQADSIQRNKNTDRIQKIDVYDNNHVPMNREQLGVNNTVNLPVAQDTLNPNLENITSRFINLDSQFRQASGGSETLSTDYTLDLSDPLTNVLNLRLYSVQIPFTWYVIDNNYGNTCFWITNSGNTFKISVEPGNYNPSQFVTELNTQFTNAGFNPANPVSYNSNNGKITINLDGFTDPSSNPIVSIPIDTDFDATTDAFFTFFDFSGELNCLKNACNVQNITFNSTLGWIMGFRSPIEPIYNTPGNRGIAVLDLYGPKYFILVIDDYNQNHINNGLITITEQSNKLSLPSYYNTSQPYICTNDSNNTALFSQNLLGNLASITENTNTSTALGINVQNFINSVQDKLDFGYGQIQVLLPSAPRTLTQAQIYTINEIIKNRQRTTSYRAKAPTASDTFALIPIKRGGLAVGDLYVEFGSSLQNNKRIYFGPVNIDRMRIKLLDDKGFLVDLHGVDWCFTLISENLYQY